MVDPMMVISSFGMLGSPVVCGDSRGAASIPAFLGGVGHLLPTLDKVFLLLADGCR